MSNYIVTGTELTTVADAIRAKSGTSEVLTFPEGFVSAVEGIQVGNSNVEFGEIVMVNDDSLEITHSLGCEPDFVVLRTLDLYDPSVFSETYHTKIAQVAVKAPYVKANGTECTGVGIMAQRRNTGDAVTTNLQAPTEASPGVLSIGRVKGGCTYQWCVGVF